MAVTAEQRELYEKLRELFRPDQIQKVSETGVEYISYDDVIERLNNVAGEWESHVVRDEVMPYGLTSNGNERLLIRGIVRLTIPSLGSREHMGVQIVTVSPRGEDMFKGVISDGTKKAAEMFGVPIDPTTAAYKDRKRRAAHQQPTPKASPAPKPQADKRPTSNVVADTITEEQRSAIQSLCDRAAIRVEGVVNAAFGAVPIEHLTTLQAQTLIRDLQAGKFSADAPSEPIAEVPAISERQKQIIGELITELQKSANDVSAELGLTFQVDDYAALTFAQAVTYIEALRKEKHTRRASRGA